MDPSPASNGKYQSLLSVPFLEAPYVTAGLLAILFGGLIILSMYVAGRVAENAECGDHENDKSLRSVISFMGAAAVTIGILGPLVIHPFVSNGYRENMSQKIEQNTAQKYDVLSVKLEDTVAGNGKEIKARKATLDDATGKYFAIASVSTVEHGERREHRYEVRVDPGSGEPTLTPLGSEAPELELKR